MASHEPVRDWRAVHGRRKHEIESAIPDAYRLPSALLQSDNALRVPSQSGILTDRELQITESQAVNLLASLRRREYTAVEVVTAFCKRAAIAHQMVLPASLFFPSQLECPR